MKFAICNELFENWDFQKVVQLVAKTGYQGLELAPFTIAETVTEVSAARRGELRRIAEDAGITIAGLHWLLVKPAGLYINHPDATVRLRTVDYLRQLIDFCADLGGEIMVFGSPNQRRIQPETGYETGRRLAIESFLSCAQTASERGVTICLEALPTSQTNFLNTNAEVRAVVQAINHPNIQMMLDVKSMCSEELPLPRNIMACQDHFRHFHANDANMRGPGFGEVDFRPIMKTLRQLGYQGYVSVEVFDFRPDPETIAVQSLNYLKSCLNDAAQKND
ncbi:sugar phosphate isomerase/epimerase [Hydrogenispora ethanolica]|jgi:sugar phosphate isomerase/epimerase|uniref:Sugar phosphate isomerase/epimerase n=1 Tax=Hydrogenispora ethanolica TaxID=1082276 RepID=A0A4R1RTR3_HYDET|nr:sugar phosphate isomerase/epimerase family protein [Hydrogenispora ethanolica]TCL69382.1 sugar phosphate isomerase/epimerase [Hydrogenispora ethanolica]